MKDVTKKRLPDGDGQCYGELYKATFPNGKVYVGRTRRSMKIRMKEHISAARGKDYCVTPFHEAIREHGAPKFELLCRAVNRRAYDWGERAYIDLYNSLGEGGYNSKPGGGGGIYDYSVGSYSQW